MTMQTQKSLLLVLDTNQKIQKDRNGGSGHYFSYWEGEEVKAKALAAAIDFLLTRTDETYISRCRLEEIATRALDEVKEAADPDYLGEFISELDLSEFEKGFFEIDDIDSEEVD